MSSCMCPCSATRTTFDVCWRARMPFPPRSAVLACLSILSSSCALGALCFLVPAGLPHGILVSPLGRPWSCCSCPRPLPKTKKAKRATLFRCAGLGRLHLHCAPWDRHQAAPPHHRDGPGGNVRRARRGGASRRFSLSASCSWFCFLNFSFVFTCLLRRRRRRIVVVLKASTKLPRALRPVLAVLAGLWRAARPPRLPTGHLSQKQYAVGRRQLSSYP